MSVQTEMIGVVRLSRDTRRSVLIPWLIAIGGIAVGGAGWLLLPRGPVAIGSVLGGLLIFVGGAFLSRRLRSIRLLVWPGALEVRWSGGSRRYLLVRGPLARASLEGGSSALRPRLGPLGIGLGSATLRGDEHIELLRLAMATTLLLVPTDRGRLAIAAASEDELLSALRSAAAPPPPPAAAPTWQPARSQPSEMAAGPPAAPPLQPVSPPPRLMTGIERALLEERRAAEQAAALAVAEAEAADRPSSNASLATTTAVPVIRPRSRRVRTGATWSRPAWLARATRLPQLSRLGGLLPIGAPLVVAALTWGVASVQERLSGPSPEARYLVLALALSGPLAVFAALVARAWQPRIIGLVSWSAIGAQVVIARVVFG